MLYTNNIPPTLALLKATIIPPRQMPFGFLDINVLYSFNFVALSKGGG
jgi:hypothetical protein